MKKLSLTCMFVLLHSEEVPDDGSGLTGVVAGLDQEV